MSREAQSIDLVQDTSTSRIGRGRHTTNITGMNAFGNEWAGVPISQFSGDGTMPSKTSHVARHVGIERSLYAFPVVDKQPSCDRNEARTPRNDFLTMVHHDWEVPSYEKL